MPFRITQESYRPRVSDRTMVGTLPARSACKFQEPNGVDNGSCHETVAMGTTRSDAPQRKAVQTKRQPARGRAGCARNSTASGEGRKMSLDIPFYRTFPQRRRRLDELHQPDISLATKSGHFNLLRTEPIFHVSVAHDMSGRD